MVLSVDGFLRATAQVPVCIPQCGPDKSTGSRGAGVF